MLNREKRARLNVEVLEGRIVPNAAPVAFNDGTYSFHPSITNGSTLNISAANGVLANDTDADLDMLTAVKDTDPSHGSATLYSDGSFSYMPMTGYVGSDSFTYHANDMFLDSNTATVNLSVTNAAPVAYDGAYNVHQDGYLDVSAGQGVLSLVSDADDGDTLTAVLVDYVSHGTIMFSSDGSFTYTPGFEWTGTDSFTYYANDGFTDTDTKTVSIFVGNHAPVAYGLTLDTKPNVALSDLDIVAWYTFDADGDSVSLTFPAGPYHGSLSQNQDGTYTYTPATNWSGTDSFTFTANDGFTDSNAATIAINVGNNAPVIGGNLCYTVYPTASLTLTNLLANASDPDGDTLSVVIDSGPSHGSLSIDANGTYVYTADNYTGSDSFTYHVNDGLADSDTITVSITLTSTPAIIANAVLVQTEMEQEVVIPQATVLANTMSHSGYPSIVSYNDYTAAAHGTVTRNGDFHYTPDDGFSGTDSFSYTVYDGTNSVTSLVQIAVQERPLGILNFTPVAGVAETEQATFTLRLQVTATRGPAFDLRQEFTNQQGIEGVVCSYFAARLTQAGWNFTRNGNQLTITHLRVDLSNYNINAIGIYSNNTLAEQYRPVANRFGGVGSPP